MSHRWTAPTLLLGLLCPGICQAKTPALNELKDILGFQGSPQLQVTKLYPVGFSKTGKLAYISIPPDQAVGCLVWEFVVLNLVNDKETARLSWRDFEGMECLYPESGLQKVAKRHGPAIKTLLKRHRISASSQPILQSIPLGEASDPISVVLSQGPTLRSQDSVSTHISVRARSARRGQKRVGALQANPPNIYGHKLVGALKSPHEARVAVIIREDTRGFEGPPNIAGFKLFGLSLKHGFEHKDLDSIVAAAPKELIPLRPEANRKWCKNGKPRASGPVPQNTRPCPRGMSPGFCRTLGTPTKAQSVYLTEDACAGPIFRLKLHSWSYKNARAAKEVVKTLIQSNHNGPDMKRVHRIWRTNKTVFMADSGAFAHWDRFTKTLEGMGLTRNACKHR